MQPLKALLVLHLQRAGFKIEFNGRKCWQLNANGCDE
jgi:hypothetical protein